MSSGLVEGAQAPVIGVIAKGVESLVDIQTEWLLSIVGVPHPARQPQLLSGRKVGPSLQPSRGACKRDP